MAILGLLTCPGAMLKSFMKACTAAGILLAHIPSSPWNEFGVAVPERDLLSEVAVMEFEVAMLV
jgi:hypothetical protein